MAYEVTDFQIEVIERSHQKPVLVDFWAEWCGPCRVLGPTIEAIAERNQGAWILVKVNTEEFPEIAQQYGIQSIPAVKLFVDGEVRDEFVGALPENRIEQWLKKALPSPNRNRILEAEDLFRSGKIEKAEALLLEILSAEPNNAAASVLLGQMYVSVDPDRALSILTPIEPDSPLYSTAEALRMFASLFKYADNPTLLADSPVKAAYLDAISDLRVDAFASALEGFVEVLSHNRQYDQDGARRACVAIFRILGEEHETTRQYRRPFSNALYA